MATSSTRRLHIEILALRKRMDEELLSFQSDRRIAANKLAFCQAANKEKDTQIFILNRTIENERVQRVAAQRGLVRYMREHGMTERIGYDPDQDRIVQEDIVEGRIAPLD